MDTTTPAAERELHRAAAGLPESIERVIQGSERRISVPFQDIKVRTSGAAGENSVTFSGVAAVTGQMTTLYEGRFWTFREIIAPGAFRNVLAMDGLDVHLNNSHDMSEVFARLTSVGEDPDVAVPVGGMKLWESGEGLRVLARLDTRKTSVQDLIVDLEERERPGGGTFRVVDQMSFAFYIGEDRVETVTDDEGHETDTRTIISVADLIDVCVCARGAYPTTSAALRTAVMGHADPAGLRPRHGDQPGVSTDVTSRGADDTERARRRAAVRVRARMALTERPTA